MSKNLNEFLIAIRAYNEAKNLPKLIKEIKKLGYKNILIVDDSSTDNTKEVINDLKKEFPDLLYVRHIQNTNMGGALLTEFKVAKKMNKHLITLDGDLQHNPKDIKNFLEINKFDVILGNRYLTKNKVPIFRKILHNLNTLFNLILNRKKINDVHNGFRAYNKKVLDLFIKELHYFDGSYADNITYIISKYKLNFIEVPTTIKYSEETLKKGQKVHKTFLKILLRSFLLRFFSRKKLFVLSFILSFFINAIVFSFYSFFNKGFIIFLILNFFLVFALIYMSLIMWYKKVLEEKKLKNLISEISIEKYLK